MKKLLMVFTVFIAVLAIGGSIWVVSAQSTDPENPEQYYTCPGYTDGEFTGRYGMYGRGMMGGYFSQGNSSGCSFANQENPMHTAMLSYFSDALNISVDEIAKRMTEGETLFQIAAAAGLSEAEIGGLMQAFHASYFESSDLNNEFFQERLERMKQMWSGENFSGYPNGGCHSNGQFGNFGGMMRWLQPQS